jgi:hypothetical protein
MTHLLELVYDVQNGFLCGWPRLKLCLNGQFRERGRTVDDITFHGV